MFKAQEYLRQGMTAYQAAKLSGISQGAISKSKACQQIIAERNADVSVNTSQPAENEISLPAKGEIEN
jgi:hypothetical protein